jgi:hypothetical protein
VVSFIAFPFFSCYDLRMENGSDGIPLFGKTEAYATEMWLDDPSAFWLHPEGPLSETTPDEWRAKLAAEERLSAEAERNRQDAWRAQWAQAANMQNPYANGLLAAHQQQLTGRANPLLGGLFGSALGQGLF